MTGRGSLKNYLKMKNIMNKLNEIKYNFIIELAKYFIEEYKDGYFKNFDVLIRSIKVTCSFVEEITFTFDESIWPPNKPELHNNLIVFKVKLINQLEYLQFGLLMNEDMYQETIFN